MKGATDMDNTMKKSIADYLQQIQITIYELSEIFGMDDEDNDDRAECVRRVIIEIVKMIAEWWGDDSTDDAYCEILWAIAFGN